jgi:hypothetical protein
MGLTAGGTEVSSSRLRPSMAWRASSIARRIDSSPVSSNRLSRARCNARSEASSTASLRLLRVSASLPRSFRLAERRPGTGSRSDGTSHLLVLQQLDVQVSFGRPRGAGDVPEPGRGEVERRLPVGERAHDTRTPSDFAQDALEAIESSPPELPRVSATLMYRMHCAGRSDPSTSLLPERPVE